MANPGFEGVEKNLELDFAPNVGDARGLRAITREQWDAILLAARCSILSSMTNDRCDAYVLSESSLFVYTHKLILKTCGTTTLLVCLEPLLKATEELSLKVEWVAYTRKDFTFPKAQKFPHRDPGEEAAYLMRFFPTGTAHMLGPITSDHWLVFVADYVDRPTAECVDRTLDIMMFDIDEAVARLFFQDRARFPKDTDVTTAAGIDTLLPGSRIQEFCFEPCGYSMNGLLYDAYWTIHITPESHCSYASFETNIRMPNYDSLVRAVLSIFRPQRYTMTLFADEYGLRSIKSSPFHAVLPVPLVTSADRAIMGPCVLTRDRYGNSVFVEGGGGPEFVEGSGDAPRAPGLPAGDGAHSPVSDTRSEGDVTDPKKIAASPALHAAPGPSGELISIPPLLAEGLGESASGATTAAGASEASAEVALSAAAALPASPRTAGWGGAGRRTGATILPSPSRGKGVLTYLLTAKCSTEFLGYVSMLGNFALVHAAKGSLSSAAATGIAGVAGGLLDMPRAKHALAEKALQAHGRQRTESA